MSKYRTLLPVILICILVACSHSKSPNRKTILLSGNWDFCVDSLSRGDSLNWVVNGFPQNSIRKVSVPHAWNTEKGLEQYWGKCWYERKFDLSKDDIHKMIRLQFDAVYHDAIVYINGRKAGEHIGSGYNRFYIDITSYCKAGINTVAVQVDNSPSRNNIPFMKSFDWANDGGIYRNVYLLITETQAIQNARVVALPEGNKGLVNIDICFVDSAKIDPLKLKISASITEENQKTRNRIYYSELKGNYRYGHFKATLNFDSIHPWHFDSPSLYKLTLQLAMDGVVKDEFSTVFGFRSIAIENNRYILNGEPVRLMGLEWMPGSNLERGMAETSADFEKNLQRMKNVNCIFTRFHWQQDEYVFDWCDRNGILVQEEIPYWGWPTLLNDTLYNLGRQHLNEMIDNHFNHPSIIAWGIGNEIQSHNPENKTALTKLYNLAKELDSSRLVNYVSNSLHWDSADEGDLPSDAAADFDVMMFNEYFSTWYGKSLDVVSGELDRIHREYPHKPLTISEWGICEPVHKGGDTRRAKEMVQQLSIYGSKEYIAGAIYFCLNDYRTHVGEDSTYSYPQRVHGVCDIHLNTKPSYDTLKKISSPILVKNVTRTNQNIVITLVGNTGIPSYTVRGYTIEAGDAKITIDELKPGEEKVFSIKSSSHSFSILRPTGYEVTRIKFE